MRRFTPWGPTSALPPFKVCGNFWIALILGAVVAGVVGVLFERFCISKVYEYPVLGFLITFALMMGLTQTIRLIWGPGNQLAPQPAYLMKVVYLGFVPISSYRLVCDSRREL